MIGRRPDGYHLLDSLVVFAAVGDTIEARPAQAWSLAVRGPASAGLDGGPDNLVLRAAAAFAARHGGPRAHLTLEKRLPVAAGLGGGSADAAATLRLLDRLRQPEHASVNDLLPIAESLGADVPVCLRSQPARMAGAGEILCPAPVLPPFGLVLLNPGVAISTAAVFAARAGAHSQPASLPGGWASAASMAGDLAHLDNDLESPARYLAPLVGEVIAALATTPGCRLARMSGSGATCFGLFDEPSTAAAAAALLARPGWWCWGGAPFRAESATA